MGLVVMVVGVGGIQERDSVAKQHMERSGRTKEQFKEHKWQAAVTACVQGGRASEEKQQGGARFPILDNAWMLVLLFLKPENTRRAEG